MIRILRALSVLIALFVATPALAIDTSFHTYDGFAETVENVERVGERVVDHIVAQWPQWQAGVPAR